MGITSVLGLLLGALASYSGALWRYHWLKV